MKLPYGYTIDNQGSIALDDQRSEIVRLIYQSYLSGLSLAGLSSMLFEKNIPSPTGKKRWTPAMLDKLLFNKKYIAVVGMEQYFSVQFERDKRSRFDLDTGKRKTTRYNSGNVFSGLLVCAECYRNYRRVQRASGEIVWRCANRVEHGNRNCKNSPSIAEVDLMDFLYNILGMDSFDQQMIKEKVELIVAHQNGKLEIELKPEYIMTFS